MWRSLFLAIGISMCILGAECMVVDRATFKLPAERVDSSYYESETTVLPPRLRVVTPPEWAPWSFLSAGAVVSLYSFMLARGD